jgi:hypothetical protein
MLLSVLLAGVVGVASLRASLTLPELRARTKELGTPQFATADVDPSLLYPAHNLSVPIDHFHNDST